MNRNILKGPWGRSRHKTIGMRSPRSVTITLEPPTGTPTTAVVNVKARESTWDCNDIVTPGFQQLAAKGVIVNNPLSMVKTIYGSFGDTGFEARRTDGSGTHKWYCDKDLAAITWGDQGPNGLQRVSQDNLVRLSQTQALAGVQTPTFESFVALAELKETLGMLLRPKRALLALLRNSEREYIRDLRRYGNRINRAMKKRTHAGRRKALDQIKRAGDKRTEPIGQLEFIPDMVLSYNLGWKPLMMDIDAIIREIPALELQERRTSRVTKSDSVKWSETKVLTHPSGNVGTFRFDYEESCVVRSGIMYADGFNISQHFGTRLRDVPSAVWEALPFSFLADYVVNVGDYIKSLTSSAAQTALAYFTKVTITTKVKRTWVSLAVPAPWAVVRQPQGSDVAEYEAVLRWPDPFEGHIAHTPLFDWAYRPPAQLQNVMSLLTSFLFSVRTKRTE